MGRKAIRNTLYGAAVLIAAIGVAFAALISLELAVALFVLSSVCGIVVLERTRRANWEMSVDFRFKHLREKFELLEGEVKRFAGTSKGASKRQSLKQKPASRPINNSQPISFEALLRGEANSSAARSKPLTSGKRQSLPKHEITSHKKPRFRVVEDSNTLSDMVVEELTSQAIKNKQIEMFMQPIMRLPQGEAKHYEVFSRVRTKAGVYLPASRYIGLAAKNDQLGAIDEDILEQCLDILRAKAKTAHKNGFFININAKTLKNGAFMGKLLAFLPKNRELAPQLVFEMKQSEFRDLPISVLKIMNGLAKLGCSFALDRVMDLNEDIADLQRFNVRFLKVDAKLFLNAAKNERRYKGIMKTKRLLEGNGIGIIAEKIEDEKMMRGLERFHLHYGQGYYFARPDLQEAYESEMKVSNHR